MHDGLLWRGRLLSVTREMESVILVACHILLNRQCGLFLSFYLHRCELNCPINYSLSPLSVISIGRTHCEGWIIIVAISTVFYASCELFWIDLLFIIWRCLVRLRRMDNKCKRGWWVISSEKQIEQLRGALHGRGIRERVLHRIITKDTYEFPHNPPCNCCFFKYHF